MLCLLWLFVRAVETFEAENLQGCSAQVKAMTPQEVLRVWAEYMSALMKQLSLAENGGADASTQAEGRILQLLQEATLYTQDLQSPPSRVHTVLRIAYSSLASQKPCCVFNWHAFWKLRGSYDKAGM